MSAPSGTGKSTIINALMQDASLRLGFSISATSRKPRGAEKHGCEYYFLTPEEFKSKAENGEFVEWEEVYQGTCYGTLKSEVERITAEGNLIMDIDVKGALNVKKCYGDRAISIFITPPSLGELERRLRSRQTDTEEAIRTRLAKAEYEMSFSEQFDHVIMNDTIEQAVLDVKGIIIA